jgi:phosphonopyruvate decarboxylase
MINPIPLFQLFIEKGINFISGVPDSLMAPLILEIEQFARTKDGLKLVPAANEGLAVSMCVGSYLANGKPGVVFMQNSGIGNAINPLLSLVHYSVFDIPLILLIGWRGEPPLTDEPQHKLQGQLTIDFLDAMEAKYVIVMDGDDFQKGIEKVNHLLVSNELNIFAFVFSRRAFV